MYQLLLATFISWYILLPVGFIGIRFDFARVEKIEILHGR